ncbi:MAG: hypothetical protein BWX98_02638 [Candidatus Aminicenantes bacterium ADurb.Bin147]|nr:MAG: hypothetical protein BWX98_02638 [Candidatus Aminicenantes bacterium ADurb.Bin147]
MLVAVEMVDPQSPFLQVGDLGLQFAFDLRRYFHVCILHQQVMCCRLAEECTVFIGNERRSPFQGPPLRQVEMEAHGDSPALPGAQEGQAVVQARPVGQDADGRHRPRRHRGGDAGVAMPVGAEIICVDNKSLHLKTLA